MSQNNVVRLMLSAGLILLPAMLGAQAFPVAVGTDTCFSRGAVYGGQNGIVSIHGDSLSPNNITAQRVYPPDSLIGDRISIGRQGIFPGAAVRSDGTNYLLVWIEYNGDFNGQFIDNSGNLVGSYFTIGTNASFDHPSYDLCYGDTTFLVVYTKSGNYLHGQLVSRSGNLIGGQIQISGNQARDVSIAYDGSNFLVAWVEIIPTTDKDVYGQFVSKNGTLVGANFVIDNGPYYSDNPTALAFDGTRYLLCQHEGTATATMLLGRFITTSGTVDQTITICDSARVPQFPSVAFDGANYLVTWTQIFDRQLMGRFWDPAGVPVAEPFVVLDSIDSKIPFGGVGFGGDWFLVVGSRVDMSFTDGDVYGSFIYKTGIEEGGLQMPGDVVRFQAHPNPFRAQAELSFNLAAPAFVSLKVYDVTGREAATVISELLPGGSHTRQWDATGMPSGVYYCRLRAGSATQTKALLLLR
ncbi:T9SS type A sorting domain-containing protein [candidate division WOR-3 bacterium]|nr:T9SS type A sorting domain-containing protein [candidate division WOR-3 bacterium]